MLEFTFYLAVLAVIMYAAHIIGENTRKEVIKSWTRSSRKANEELDK